MSTISLMSPGTYGLGCLRNCFALIGICGVTWEGDGGVTWEGDGEFTSPSILRELSFQVEVLRRTVAQDLRCKDVGYREDQF